ncbi:hypothetical protein [Paenibacillus sp. OSY-SE]|uniref:hypothetical protein n=1 Tax=Paenibacillus sp. OSY-SE TaxID=1196323 RepID=UPI000315013B|nr:hypothetical protein [Paenibacillus sp. OSY-SE]
MIIEFKKLVKNKITYISMGSLLLIVIAAVWSGAGEFQEERALAQKLYANYPDALAFVSPHQYWVGLSNVFFSSLYYFIFPLLIALPIVDTIYNEKMSGNLHYEIIRMSRFSYFSKKFLFVFIASFLFFIFPLMIGILLMNVMTGQWDFSGYSQVYNKLMNGTVVLPDNVLSSQFRILFSEYIGTSPYLYIIVYYIIGGLYAGVYTCFGLSASLFINNRYLILFMPICLYLGCWITFSLLGLLAWDPFNFLDPRQPVIGLSYLPFIIDFIVLLFVTVLLYIAGVRKHGDVHS